MKSRYIEDLSGSSVEGKGIEAVKEDVLSLEKCGEHWERRRYIPERILRLNHPLMVTSDT